MSGGIFINYRRGDQAAFAGRLFDRLEQAFPGTRLFMDVDNIPPGVDFTEFLDNQVRDCDVMLTVIGEAWLSAIDSTGKRRLEDEDDFVRIEIVAALQGGKRVIPVLVGNAAMVGERDLPDPLKELARRNAVRVTHERFRSDCDGLVRALKPILEHADRVRSELAERAAAEAKAKAQREAEAAERAQREAMARAAEEARARADDEARERRESAERAAAEARLLAEAKAKTHAVEERTRQEAREGGRNSELPGRGETSRPSPMRWKWLNRRNAVSAGVLVLLVAGLGFFALGEKARQQGPKTAEAVEKVERDAADRAAALEKARREAADNAAAEKEARRRSFFEPIPTNDGTCAGADFRQVWGAKELPQNVDSYQTTALREGVIVYSSPTGNARRWELRFNEKAYVRAAEAERLGVALEGDNRVAGWVRRTDLLCNRAPLRSVENRMERKAIIRAQEKEGRKVVQAYAAPDMAACQPACRELTHFTMYFIAAETSDGYLLADSYLFQTSRSVLVGWVRKSDVVEWTLPLGLRGAESLKFTDSKGPGPGAICAYLDLADMRAKRQDKCQPILGGSSWFETENRLLITTVRDDYYEVVAPIDSFVQTTKVEGGKITVFDPTQPRREIVVDIRGGAALQEVIGRRKAAIPALFHGPRIVNDVRQLYIARDEKVDIDVFMRLNQLRDWGEMLRSLDEDETLGQRRRDFINTLIKELERIIGRASFDDKTEKISAHMRRLGGLPMGTRSPLLDYSIEELLRPDYMPDCERSALLDWAKASRAMLKLAESCAFRLIATTCSD